ncbi:MAG TPA: 30S ribosomal protein S17 [Nitrospirae bacterium]|nr:30S ribosomal protein S17 [bacterium BMS3Abin09]GBE41493.1 30S ribosomal protein S17 [bacterium BMS3Bbin09]HDN94773.1 30S ribosomal protein S17 [Nitrospirota bacterium]HDO67233.1 30S ribosomal protein S17 [Nitrospirota bacterium]HDZ84482.1 30S ribosomal protein S17 [Nitrospirota bacterium]
MPKKNYTGEVISDKMQKTVVVAVTRLTQHPLYKKTIKKVVKFKAHDEEGTSKKGDIVSITESRPLSKDKRWRVLDVVRRGSE